MYPHFLKVADTQHTHNICIKFIQRRPNAFDVGPTLYKCYTNVMCSLGSLSYPRDITYGAKINGLPSLIGSGNSIYNNSGLPVF